MRQKLGLCLAAFLLVGLLAACGGADDGVTLDPVDSACAALDQVNDALKFTALVGINTDILDIISAQTQLQNSWRTLVTEVQKLDAAMIPPSLTTANEAFDAIPMADQTTAPAAAVAAVNQQSEIAQSVVDEFTPVCAAQPAN